MCRTYDFLDDSALYSIPVQLGEVRLHIMVFVHVSSRLSHCVSSCFHLFVCVAMLAILFAYGAKSNISYRVVGTLMNGRVSIANEVKIHHHPVHPV